MWTVKSPGVTSSRSSQVTGNDTGTPGRTRGLYAATTVPPPTRVESTKTLPPRSSFTNSVVATSGSRAAARAAMARVAAAASSSEVVPSMGTNTWSPLAPLVLTRAGQPEIGQRLADEAGRPHGHRERVALGRVEVEHEVGHVLAVVDAQQRGVVLDGALVGEPQQRAAVVAERVGHLPLGRLRPEPHRAHPLGRVLRHVLLHEGLLAPVDPDHRQRPVGEHGEDPVADAVEVVDQVPLGGSGAVEERLVEVGQRHAVARLGLLLRAHAHHDGTDGAECAP